MKASVKLTVIGVALIGYSLILCAKSATAQDNPVNLALGKVATFDPSPNYAYCTDPDDKWQLTDGKYSGDEKLAVAQNTDAIWVQKGTVGWQGHSPIISFDLGQVQPISGFSFSTAAGRAGVTFPDNIYVGVSDDGVAWHSAGDLVALSNKIGLPRSNSYTKWRYVTHALHQHGRYVAFSVIGVPFVFCDEIEIYRGADGWVNEPPSGTALTNLRQFTRANMVRTGMARRLVSDLNAVRVELASSRLPEARRRNLENQLNTLASQCDTDSIPLIDPVTFRAVVPINETDARILAVHGAILRATQPPLVLWKQHRYQWLPLLAVPPQHLVPPVLDISMMKNEYRSDSLLLTDAGTAAMPIAVKVVGSPELDRHAITMSDVPFTDTARGKAAEWIGAWGPPPIAFFDTSGRPVASALPELKPSPNGYRFSVPAGLTTKLWITIDSSLLTPGSYKAKLEIRAGEITRAVPLTVRVSRVGMGRPRLSLGMWDYTDGTLYGITPDNRGASIALMRSHFVDTPWAASGTLPMAGAADFDADNKLVAPLNWKPFDEWVARWPGARNYCLFAAVDDEIAGAKGGTPAFNARVGTWASALAQGIRARRLRPEQIAILLVDEPQSDEQAATTAAWEHAIKAAAPELSIFVDPAWERPDLVAPRDALTQADILSPNLESYLHEGAPVVSYFKARQAAGQKLWFYQCFGPARSLDPTRYYRFLAWQAFESGAVGMGLWAFGDSGGSPSSWDEYLNQATPCTPVFLDANSATNSIQWDAVREGIEDYEYLSMLRDRIATSADVGWKARAQAFIDRAPAAVMGVYSPEFTWEANPRVDLADKYRLEALKLLETAR